MLVLLLLTTFAALRYTNFLGAYNVSSVLRYISMFALVALGMCFVIMTGGIDLSVGSVAAASSVVAALCSPYGLGAGLAGGLGMGLAAGLLNALIITRLKILPFIAMQADPTVILMGEDIGVYGGAFQVTLDLIDRFGPDRVMDTPISELGGAGVAVGAALTGLKPIFEFQFSDFAMLAMEQIVNQAAKLRYMLGGEASVPVVFRMPSGSGTGAAAQHSQSIEAWFGHVPGLKVLQPSTPEDAKGMLLAALADPDPVMIFEHKLLYKMKGHVPEGSYLTPIGKALVRRTGTDLTIVAGSIMLHRALEAAEKLAAEGMNVEVIDLRSIRPIDRETILTSVRKTGKLLVVYEGVKAFGVGAEISAMVAESDAFDYLDAPILRLGAADAPVPYNPDLERASVPQVNTIEAAARRLVRREV